MEFLLLGPVELRAGHDLVPLGGSKQRALAAMLALDANHVVSRERLVDGLWGDAPPASADHTVESYVSRLRRILRDLDAPDAVQTRPPGYLLDLGADDIDVHRFRRLAADGRSAITRGDPDAGVRLLDEAVALFRGPPLDDLAFLPFAAPARARLEEERLAAVEDRVEAALATGRAGDLIPELRAQVEAHPLRERAHAQLMLALYREGRQSDALAAYRQARGRLRDELGVEPGPMLRDLERSILRQDPSLGVGTASRSVAVASTPASPPEPPARVLQGPPPSPSAARRRWLASGVALVLLVPVGAAIASAVRRPDPSPPPQPAAHLRPSSVAQLSLDAGRLLRQAALPGDPTAIVTAGDATWVADPARNVVTRLDPTTGRPSDTVPLPGQPTGIAVGGGSVWVTAEPDVVLRISPETDTVVQRIEVGRSPVGLAFEDGAVFVVAADDQTLDELDAATGAVRRTVQLDARPAAVAVADGAVWVSSADTGTVYRMSPDGHDLDGIPVGTAPGPLGAWGHDVWVANTLDGTLSRIDSDSDVVTATVVTGRDPVAVAMGRSAIWVADGATSTLTEVDPRAASVIRTITLDVPPVGVAASADRLWVSAGRSSAAHRGGTLHVAAVTRRFDSIDPAMFSMLFPPQLVGMTNDGLVTLRHVGGATGTQVVPDLATTVPLPSDHGRSYRFELRRGIRYSTGAPVRPGDIRRAIERDLTMDSPGSTFYAGIVGARACLAGRRPCDLRRGITVDAATSSVTFHLTHPDADFLDKLTLSYADVVPAGTPDHDIGTHPLPATGPYLISRYRPGHSLVLERNPSFRVWSGAAQPDGYPDRIVYRFGLSPASVVSAIAHGTADWGDYVFPWAPPPHQVARIRTRFAAQLHTNPLPETEFFTLDTRVPPFDDVRVRRALNDAIDRNRLVRMYGGKSLAAPTCQLLPPGLPGHASYCPYSTGRPAAPYAGTRLAAARRLVAASGTAGLRVRVIADPRFRPAAYVTHVLRQLGYRAELVTASGRRIDRLENNPGHVAQVNMVGWAADYPSAAEFLDYFLSCDAIRPHSEVNANTAEFCNARVDAGIARAERLQASDPAAAVRTWEAVDRRVTDLGPTLPTVNLKAVDFVSSRVGGYEFNPQWGILLDQLWVR